MQEFVSPDIVQPRKLLQRHIPCLQALLIRHLLGDLGGIGGLCIKDDAHAIARLPEQIVLDCEHPLQLNVHARLLQALPDRCGPESLAAVNSATWDPPAAVFCFVHRQKLPSLRMPTNYQRKLVSLEYSAPARSGLLSSHHQNWSVLSLSKTLF